MLDANPKTRITMAMIKEDEWFKEGYTPANPEDEEESVYIDEDFSIHDVVYFVTFSCLSLIIGITFFILFFLYVFACNLNNYFRNSHLKQIKGVQDHQH